MIIIIWVKLATVVKGDPKSPFSIVTTPRCRGWRYSIPWIAPLYPWSISYNAVKQGGIKYPFLSLWYDSIWDWECSRMIRETWVQSQVESYQKLKKWYLIPPCLTLSIIRYTSRVKWVHPGKGEAPSPTPWCSSYWKGNLWVTLDNGRQLIIWYITGFFYAVRTRIITRKLWMGL